MTKILGGRYRNIRVINGKTCIKVQAVVPMPKDLKKAEKVCELNRWNMTSDHFGNLSVTTNMSFSAYLLSDRTLMDAYLGFAEKVTTIEDRASIYKEMAFDYENDKFIFLVTCDYNINNGRMVLVGKRLKKIGSDNSSDDTTVHKEYYEITEGDADDSLPSVG